MPDLSDLQLPASLAPPMENGEAVFAAPWEGRVFGMAKALADQGLFHWDEFRDCLIAQIAQQDAQRPQAPYHYYERFQAALLALLQAKHLIAPKELESRLAALAARPHAHDH